MGFRFRKTLKILPGVSLNIGKTGVSTSIGGKGARVTLGKHGTRTTVGIPGTGASYTSYQRNEQPPVRTGHGKVFWFLIVWLAGTALAMLLSALRAV